MEKPDKNLPRMLVDLQECLISKDEAAAAFNIKRRYFNRLLAANKFGLADLKVSHPYLNGEMFWREDIERLSTVYKLQQKKRRTAPQSK